MSRKNKSKGQALIEFALTLPLILLLVVGALDLGRVFHAQVVLTNAAREGANYISYFSDDKDNCTTSGPLVCYLGTIQAVQDEANSSGIIINQGNITVTECCTRGSPVQVSVSYTMNLAILDFFSGPVTMSRSVRMISQ